MHEAIVHIGLNKTGSSTIQAWLRRNADELLNQRIKYDSLKVSREKPGHLLGFEGLAEHLGSARITSKVSQHAFDIKTQADQDRVFSEFQERFFASVTTGDFARYIISSEALFKLGAPHYPIEPFASYLQSIFTSVKFVMYLRDQIDWYPSAYAQFIRTGGTKSFDEYLGMSKIRNYATIAQSWASIVGAQNFSVRLLERDFLTNGDLIEDFASVIGADITQPERVKDRNVGLSAGQLAAMRRTNKITSVLPERVRVKYQTRIFSYVTGNGNTRKMTPTDAQSRRIAERHAFSNEQLRTQFFPERPILFKKSAAVLSATSPAGDPAHRTPKASHATAHTGHQRNN